jgi:hypothetical protein
MKLFRIKSSGESGRGGIHPWHFLRICFRSSCKASAAINVLWPIVPVALAVRCKLFDLSVKLSRILCDAARAPHARELVPCSIASMRPDLLIVDYQNPLCLASRHPA